MNPVERISKPLKAMIEEILDSNGILYRSFARAKTDASIDEKIIQKQYSIGNKLLQDAIGIRIAFYFEDDIKIFISALKNIFTLAENGETIDTPDISKFSATRINLVFHLPDKLAREFKRIYQKKPIDTTFEVQLRTVLSEGWHEVEHDLRYKAKALWDNHDDLGRILNSIYGTLITCDWSIASLFSELSFRCYKSKDWEGMLRNKFRIRFLTIPLSENLKAIMDNDLFFSKNLFRLNRFEVISFSLNKRISYPKTFDNIIYFTNFFFLNNSSILETTPPHLSDDWSLSKAQQELREP